MRDCFCEAVNYLAKGVDMLDCGHEPSKHSECSTGTAHTADGREICWECCAVLDRQTMIDKGHSRNLPLYLTHGDFNGGRFVDGKVTNWPSSLKFPCRVKKGRHNIAGSRCDVWFNGPDGFVWHGVQYGEWTQICHCRRTKERWGQKQG